MVTLAGKTTSATLFKEVLLLSRGGSSLRKMLRLSDAEALLNSRKDGTWEKFVSLETWGEPDRQTLVDYDFWIDLDAKVGSGRSWDENLQSVVPDCRFLIDHLGSKFGLQPDELGIYFSGQKGFHLLLPFQLDQDLPSGTVSAAIKRFVAQVGRDLEGRLSSVVKLDTSIYFSRNMIRVPWSLHSLGVRKVPLTANELHLSASELQRIVRERSDSFSGSYDFSWLVQKRTSATFSQTIQSMISVSARSAGRNLPDDWHSQVIHDLSAEAPCIRALCEFQIPIGAGEFNKAKMFLLCQLKRHRHDRENAVAFVTGFADDLSTRGRASPAKARDRRNQVSAAATTIYAAPAGSSYDYAVGGRCKAGLYALQGKAAYAFCRRSNCPHAIHRASFPAPTRIRLEQLLKKPMTANALRTFLELAVFGPSGSLGELSKRVRLAPNTVRQAVSQLKKLGLVKCGRAVKNTSVEASIGVQKTLIVKN